MNTHELFDSTLRINHAQGFHLYVSFRLVDMDDVALPTVKLEDAKRHGSLLSNFLLENSLRFGVNEINSI